MSWVILRRISSGILDQSGSIISLSAMEIGFVGECILEGMAKRGG